MTHGLHSSLKAENRTRLLLAASLWFILAPLCLLPGFKILEYRFFDVFSTFSPPVPKTSPIILIGIDEPSFAELAMQWPWPRDMHADLITRLSEAGAAVIAFDIVFAEPSTAEADLALAEAIRKAGNVVLAADLAVEETPYVSQLIRVEPLPLFPAAGATSGVAAVALDPDGVIRRLPPYADGFAMATLAAWEKMSGNSVAGATANRLLQFFGPSRTYPYVSYYQALNPDEFLPPDIFKNRIVIIGRSLGTTPDPSARQADTFATPLTLATNDRMAGIEVHATILDNVRLGLTIQPAPGFMQPAGLALVILLYIVLFRGRHPWKGGIAGLIAMALIMGGSLCLLRFARVWLAPPLFLCGILFSYTGETGMAYFRERLARRRIKQAFDRYLPPVLVERLASDPAQLRLGGESRLMTIMFCDIREFTGLSEKYKEAPEDLVHLMNRFFTAMTTVIHEWNGTVDKYIGDCIMAFWNAPLEDPDHARRACSAALDMFDRLEDLNRELEKEKPAPGSDAVTIEMSIGINTGLCVVGNIGSDMRFDYSVLGDPVNVASRLEGQTRKYGVGIVIGPETAAAVADRNPIELDLLAVKGKHEAERIFTLLRTGEMPDSKNFPEFIRQHNTMIEAYRQGDWAAAQTALRCCRNSAPVLAMVYNLYWQRITGYKKTGTPENWAGAVQAEDK